MKKVMGAVQSVLIAMILLAILGTGTILYFQLAGKSAETAEETGETTVSPDETEGATISDDTTVSGDNTNDTIEENTGGNITPGTSHEHNYSSTVIKEATCTKDGAMQYVCKDCSDYYIEPIDAKGHKPGKWVTAIKATKEKDGLRTKSCTVCKRVLEEEVISKDTVKDPKHVHKYTSKVTKEPTCTELGVLTYTCSKCDKTYTEDIPATNHPSRQTIKTDSLCDKEGSIITTCAECGAVISHDTLLPAGHNFSAWKVTTKATATTEGSRERTCKVCDTKETEKIPATSSPESTHKHKYTSAVTTEETCTADGVITYTCTSCDASYTESIPKLGHAPGNWTVTKEPTETETGLRQRLCRRCKEPVEEEIIPIAGSEHTCTYGTPTVERKPTCIKTGTRKYTCTECGDFYTTSIDKIPHKLNTSGVCTMCGEQIEEPTQP